MMWLLVLGIWSVVVLLAFIFFKGSATNVKEMNFITPIDIEKSNIKTTIIEELRKSLEEEEKFGGEALVNNLDGTIEKFWSSTQYKLNVMSMIGIPIEFIYKDMGKHIQRMEEKGYKFK